MCWPGVSINMALRWSFWNEVVERTMFEQKQFDLKNRGQHLLKALQIFEFGLSKYQYGDHKRMKGMIVKCIVAASCAIFCAGCASFQPSPEQVAAADARPWTGGNEPTPPDHPAGDFLVTVANAVAYGIHH
jgi:hypothetical protein